VTLFCGGGAKNAFLVERIKALMPNVEVAIATNADQIEAMTFAWLAYKRMHNEKVNLKYLSSDLAKREIASIYRCDISLVISKYEMKLLKKTFNIDKSLLHYVPFLLEMINLENIESYPTFQNRQHFISIGNFKHKPNWNSIQYLKTVIWPLIREKLPDAQLYVYGAYSSEKVQQLQNKKEGFLIKGWLKNIGTKLAMPITTISMFWL